MQTKENKRKEVDLAVIWQSLGDSVVTISCTLGWWWSWNILSFTAFSLSYYKSPNFTCYDGGLEVWSDFVAFEIGICYLFILLTMAKDGDTATYVIEILSW